MPFDFKKYDAKCASMDAGQLQREWEHYTRLISGAATSTAVSGMAIPFTLGVSTIGVGLAAPAIHNARKKREIIERHLQRHGATHHTRKRDVITAGGISGTVGLLTLGLAPVGADAICGAAAEHGISYIATNELGVKIATHLALDAVAVAAEETHMHSKKEQEAWKAYAQAVKEGQNPPLPNSDLKIPIATNNQAQYSQNSYQNTAFQAPSIQVVPPLDHKTSAETVPVYFSPPPVQAELTVNKPLHHRHSTSDLSYDAKQSYTEPTHYQQSGQIIYGTTTAISGTMMAGQTYGLQLPDQSVEVPSRPASAMGGKKLHAKLAGLSSKTTDLHQQGLVSPPPPYFAQPDGLGAQSYQTASQRPRANSMVSFDGPPGYETYQQFQPSYNTSQAPLSPSFTSPASAYHRPTTPGQDYFTNSASTHPNQSQYTPSSNSTWSTAYSPADYNKPQQHQQQQPQSFHAPAQMVYDQHSVQDQKTPLTYQYEVQSSSTPTPMGSPMYYSQQLQSQTLYFPPPPPTTY